LGAVALVAGLGSPAAAQMTPITELGCTSANFPNCNWGFWGDNPHYDLTRVGNGGRFTLTPGSASGQTQFYMGWGVNGLPVPQDGQARYIRLRLRVVGPVDGTGVGDVWTDKFIVLGDGSDSGSRVIVELRPTPTGLETRIQKNIEGDDQRTPLLSIPSDQLVSLQYEARSGSSGRVAIWMNNNVYASPSRTSPNFSLPARAWNNLRVGFYSNASLASSGRVIFEVTDVQYDDQFDPNWHGGGSTGPTPPGSPSNVRIVSSSMVGLLPLGALLSPRLFRRRRATDVG
jgi:hypothetical protein